MPVIDLNSGKRLDKQEDILVDFLIEVAPMDALTRGYSASGRVPLPQAIENFEEVLKKLKDRL